MKNSILKTAIIFLFLQSGLHAEQSSNLLKYFKAKYSYENRKINYGCYYGEKSAITAITLSLPEQPTLKYYSFWKVELYTGNSDMPFVNNLVAIKGDDTNSIKLFWDPLFRIDQEDFLQLFSGITFISEQKKVAFMNKFCNMITSLLVQPKIIAPDKTSGDEIIYTLNQYGNFYRKVKFDFKEKTLIKIKIEE